MVHDDRSQTSTHECAMERTAQHADQDVQSALTPFLATRIGTGLIPKSPLPCTHTGLSLRPPPHPIPPHNTPSALRPQLSPLTRPPQASAAHAARAGAHMQGAGAVPGGGGGRGGREGEGGGRARELQAPVDQDEVAEALPQLVGQAVQGQLPRGEAPLRVAARHLGPQALRLRRPQLGLLLLGGARTRVGVALGGGHRCGGCAGVCEG